MRRAVGFPAPPAAPRGRGAERGFSFIEVLMAMGVLVVGSVSVLGLFTIGVNRMVDRRVEARLAEVRPEIDSILQARVDLARPGEMPAAFTRAEPVPLSRRGYALAVEWHANPFENAPGYLAHAELLFRGEPVRRLIIPIRRSFLHLKELEGQVPAK
jgi:prepilin-type N-terminal cleavage/methylation domain-containing protein